MKKILLTGATGFVGQGLARFLLAKQDLCLRAVIRSNNSTISNGVEVVKEEISPFSDWTEAVRDIDIIVHLAARVHVMQDLSQDPISEYRRVNVDGTLNLARQAAAAGVKRFIFLSSVKVNGENTDSGSPFREEDQPCPVDPYGVSKLEAEKGLFDLAKITPMEIVVIRSPLVYGPGVKANFRMMMKWLAKGVPLPLGAINNRRSMVFVDNLVDLIQVCFEHPQAANQVFFVSDGEDLSTTDLLKKLCVALGKPQRLLPFPQKWLEWVFHVLGKSDLTNRLCGSLSVDIEKSHQVLNWTPPVSVDQGLKITANHFL